MDEGFSEVQAKSVTIYKAVGCDRCTSGYKGRVGIFQVMPISEAMQKLILEGGNSMELEAHANSEGVLNLRATGLNKVSEGLTSLEEINRVTKD